MLINRFLSVLGQWLYSTNLSTAYDLETEHVRKFNNIPLICALISQGQNEKIQTLILDFIWEVLWYHTDYGNNFP